MRERLSDAATSPLLYAGDRLVLGAFALDVHAPPLFAKPRFTFAKNALAGVGLVQALFEGLDRLSIRNLAAGTQANEALEVQVIKQLESHLLISQIEQLLHQ